MVLKYFIFAASLVFSDSVFNDFSFQLLWFLGILVFRHSGFQAFWFSGNLAFRYSGFQVFLQTVFPCF
jgi:hypothetical protein